MVYAKWKLSWDVYTFHTRFCTFGADLYAQSVLHQSSVRSLLRVCCWLGWGKKSEHPQQQQSSFSHFSLLLNQEWRPQKSVQRFLPDQKSNMIRPFIPRHLITVVHLVPNLANFSEEGRSWVPVSETRTWKKKELSKPIFANFRPKWRLGLVVGS